MKKFLLLLAGVTFTLASCSKDDDNSVPSCRCQAETDIPGYEVYIEKRCNDVTDADLQRVLNYAGSQGVTYVYVDTAIDICN